MKEKKIKFFFEVSIEVPNQIITKNVVDEII
jgi:hypothetical protein